MPRRTTPLTELEALRKSRGKEFSQEYVAERVSQILDEPISQAAVSAWERGNVDYKKVHPSRLRAYAQVLKISVAELEKLIGFAPGDLFPEETSLTTILDFKSTIPRDVQISDSLREAIEKHGGRHPLLRNPKVQQQLALAQFYDGRGPQHPDDWLAYFLSVERWLSK